MSESESSGQLSSHSLQSQGPVPLVVIENAKKNHVCAQAVHWTEASETIVINFLLDKGNLAKAGDDHKFTKEILQAAAGYVNDIHPLATMPLCMQRQWKLSGVQYMIISYFTILSLNPCSSKSNGGL